MTPDITLPAPHLQAQFAHTLKSFRKFYLQDALLATALAVDIAQLDAQLAAFAPHHDLSRLAGFGLRGELVFAVPLMLEKNPYLVAYYRLLLGYSQKQFYTSATGAARFRSMETGGVLSSRANEHLPGLCRALCQSSSQLLEAFGADTVTHSLLHDLTLLTVGPQLRGGANNQLGVQGIVDVFEIIHEVVNHAIVSEQPRRIELRSAAGLAVYIEFAPDPDIIIRVQMSAQQYRNVVAIEIKGGTDISNVHNRIGEAEKSHQKARQEGFTECWTVVNVDHLDVDKAHRESPSTNRFYSLSALASRSGAEYEDFAMRIRSLAAIPSR